MCYGICKFLLSDTKGADLATRIFKDYNKDKKGFLFITSQFLFDVFYHKISDESEMCFVKAVVLRIRFPTFHTLHG